MGGGSCFSVAVVEGKGHKPLQVIVSLHVLVAAFSRLPTGLDEFSGEPASMEGTVRWDLLDSLFHSRFGGDGEFLRILGV